MSDECAQCNKIRALPDSPTRRDMALDHLLDLGHQARAVEAPKDEDGYRANKEYWDAPKAKPAESEALYACDETVELSAKARAEEMHLYIRRLPDFDGLLGLYTRITVLESLIETDAQRLKDATERAEKAERERDELREERGPLEQANRLLNSKIREGVAKRETLQAELAVVKGRLAKLIEGARVVARLYNLPGLLNACTEAEAGEPSTELGRIDQGLVEQLNGIIRELRADRLKWVKVCAERDNRIIELCNLMQRIRAYAKQHTQYPFANAIIALCNQVLEPKGNEHQAS